MKSVPNGNTSLNSKAIGTLDFGFSCVKLVIFWPVCWAKVRAEPNHWDSQSAFQHPCCQTVVIVQQSQFGYTEGPKLFN